MYVAKRNANIGLRRSFYTNIYNSQKAEIVDGMYWQMVAYPHGGGLRPAVGSSDALSLRQRGRPGKHCAKAEIAGPYVAWFLLHERLRKNRPRDRKCITGWTEGQAGGMGLPMGPEDWGRLLQRTRVTAGRLWVFSGHWTVHFWWGNCGILKSCLDKVAFNVCLYLDLQIQAEK